MNIDNLKDYYNRIDKCSVILDENIDFDYIQSKITKTAIYTEDLNRILGEILIEKTRLEHLVTEKEFEYELHVTEYLNRDSTVRAIPTYKERKDYINYLLMKDQFKEITNLKQELKDVESLLDLSKKRAKDLDRIYPKLKTLWEALQTDLKTIKKIGSDYDFISKVRKDLDAEEKRIKPIFTDILVEQIKEEQYDKLEKENKKEEIVNNEIDQELDDLLKDL